MKTTIWLCNLAIATGWRTLPFHLVLVYGYEILGGFLIVLSSAVAETLMPEGHRRRLWILFGIFALIYVGIGIGIRHDDVKQSSEDRREIKRLNDLTTKLVDSFNAVIPPLEADLTTIKGKISSGTTANIEAKELKNLQSRADSLQQLINVMNTVRPVQPAPNVLDLAGIVRDAMSIINRLTERTAGALKSRVVWEERGKSGVTMPHIAQWQTAQINQQFTKDYARDYEPDVIDMYHELAKHTVNMPQKMGAPREFVYTEDDVMPISPEVAEAIIYDLCNILAEFEKENKLAATCSWQDLSNKLNAARQGKSD